MAVSGINAPYRCIGKIRYAHKGTPCVVEPVVDSTDDGGKNAVGACEYKVTFDEPVRAITPGQSVVFYEEDYVLGGGSIL